MATTEELLLSLEDTKEDIKTAIEAKGVTVGSIAFDLYASKIQEVGAAYDAISINSVKSSYTNWLTPTKLSNPASLPAGPAGASVFSPDGKFLAVAHDISPYITIYSVSGSTFTKLTNPGTLPAGRGRCCSWSPDGRFLAVGGTGSPYITIYERVGTTFTKLTNPGTLPNGNVQGCSWSPDGRFLTVGTGTSPYFKVYERAGTTFTMLSDPASIPAGLINGFAWSPDGKILVLTGNGSPYIVIYSRSGSTFTKLSDPSTTPSAASTNATFSPDGKLLAVSCVQTQYLTLYSVSGTTFTKLSDPASIPTGNNCRGVAFSTDGKFLAVAHDYGVTTTRQITIYSVSGTTFTKIADPASLPTAFHNGMSCGWSPDGKQLVLGTNASPNIHIYETTASTPAPTNTPRIIYSVNTED